MRRVLLLCGLAVAACSPSAPKPTRDFSKPSGPPRVDATLPLPGGDGKVHVIAIPGAFGEVQRCIVAVSAIGSTSTACPTKDIELPSQP